MKEYMPFLIPTLFGTTLGLQIFRIVFRKVAENVSIYQRLACAIGGAFSGAFGSALILTGSFEGDSLTRSYFFSIAIATAIAVGMQKFIAEQSD